jgi:hypothetical protein
VSLSLCVTQRKRVIVIRGLGEIERASCGVGSVIGIEERKDIFGLSHTKTNRVSNAIQKY